MTKIKKDSWLQDLNDFKWIYLSILMFIVMIAIAIIGVAISPDSPEFTSETFNSFTSEKCYELIKQRETVVGVNEIKC